MISTFYKYYLEKPISISIYLNSILAITKLIVKLLIKRKQKYLAKDTIKYIKEVSNKYNINQVIMSFLLKKIPFMIF